MVIPRVGPNLRIAVAKKRILKNLPSSEDDFWEHAEKELHRELVRVNEGCEHRFYHRTAQEVECKFCHIGYFLDNYCVLKKGHIYRDGEFVI